MEFPFSSVSVRRGSSNPSEAGSVLILSISPSPPERNSGRGVAPVPEVAQPAKVDKTRRKHRAKILKERFGRSRFSRQRIVLPFINC